MDAAELLEKVSNGEDSYTQFKENITNTDKLAEELLAFSNAKGGWLIIGGADNSTIKGLADHDIRRLNLLIANVINANISPPIYPLTSIRFSRKLLSHTMCAYLNHFLGRKVLKFDGLVTI